MVRGEGEDDKVTDRKRYRARPTLTVRPTDRKVRAGDKRRKTKAARSKPRSIEERERLKETDRNRRERKRKRKRKRKRNNSPSPVRTGTLIH